MAPLENKLGIKDVFEHLWSLRTPNERCRSRFIPTPRRIALSLRTQKRWFQKQFFFKFKPLTKNHPPHTYTVSQSGLHLDQQSFINKTETICTWQWRQFFQRRPPDIHHETWSGAEDQKTGSQDDDTAFSHQLQSELQRPKPGESSLLFKLVLDVSCCRRQPRN